jgi:hypothetical protein
VLTPALIGLLAAGLGGAQGSTPAAGGVPAFGTSRRLPALRSTSSRFWFVDRSGRDGLGFGGARLGLERRLGLGRFSSALQASFARWSVGVDLPSPLLARGLAPIGLWPTSYGLLVARFGYGFYLGRPKSPRGALSVFYDRQRHLFGEGPRTVPSYARHRVGVEGTLFVAPRIGVHFKAGLGANWSGGLSLVIVH